MGRIYGLIMAVFMTSLGGTLLGPLLADAAIWGSISGTTSGGSESPGR